MTESEIKKVFSNDEAEEYLDAVIGKVHKYSSNNLILALKAIYQYD